MKKIKKYLFPEDLKINYFDKHLNVVNYDEIILLTSDKIMITKDKKTLTIKGSDLSLLKLLDKEVLIEGNIKIIEL